MEYRLLFIAKGAGSANKTALYQESRALLGSAARLEEFLREKIGAIGVAACPPYRLSLVLGGSSPDLNLKTVKLAAAGWLDGLRTSHDPRGAAYRDLEWERKVLDLAAATGLGAQFGGRYLAVEARVVRLPRHGGSFPVGLGVSCSADRQILAKINRRGVFLERLERNPARMLKGRAWSGFSGVAVDLSRPPAETAARLSAHPPGTALKLSGPLILARDLAHARFAELIAAGRNLPEYLYRYVVFYAGPAETPRGLPSGSLGPTTAQRMDGYAEDLLSRGASRIMLGKGGRSAAAYQACRRHGGIYLATIGGAAALIAREHVVASEVIDFPELGMEAVRRVTVKDLPAFIIFNGRGRGFYD